MEEYDEIKKLEIYKDFYNRFKTQKYIRDIGDEAESHIPSAEMFEK